MYVNIHLSIKVIHNSYTYTLRTNIIRRFLILYLGQYTYMLYVPTYVYHVTEYESRYVLAHLGNEILDGLLLV